LQLNANDLVLASYTLSNGASGVQQLSVEFAFTSQKILLRDELQVLFKVKTLTVYVIHRPIEESGVDDKVIDLTVSEPTDKERIVRKIHLEKG